MSNIFYKNRWIALIIVVVAATFVFEQLYSLQIVRRNNISPVNLGDISTQGNLTAKEEGEGELSEADLRNLDVDLENLTDNEVAAVRAFLKFKKIKATAIPSGVPAIYGKELDISFDAVQDAIDKVAPLDLTYGTKKIDLNSQEMARYIKIGSQTACKYCCGATTLVFENGEAACGCAHSQMMRGLAAYLIKNHPELSDKEILKELNTWRASYFPKETLSETMVVLEKSGEKGIKELLQEFPDFLPQMVGGC